MYKVFGIVLMIAMVSTAGCQDVEPSRTIVSLQIDSDGESNWIYVYTIPRIKVGNITIAIGEMTETHSSVFSNQVYITNEEIIEANITDSEGYFPLTVSADIKSIEWGFTCKIRIVSSEVDTNSFVADVLIEDDGEEIEREWQLPYNFPLEFKS